MTSPEPGTPPWEYTPEQWEEYRGLWAAVHECWKVWKAFEKAVKTDNREEILRLAPLMLEQFSEPDDGEAAPPETQPKNREEAVAWDRQEARRNKALKRR